LSLCTGTPCTRKNNWACLEKFSSGGLEAFLLRNHRYNHYQRGFLDLLKDKGKEQNIAGLQIFFNHNYSYDTHQKRDKFSLAISK
jgi:hypothetical protein